MKTVLLLVLAWSVCLSASAQDDAHLKFVNELRQGLLDVDRSKGEALEKLCAQWLPSDFSRKEPLLFARLKTCAAEAALLRESNDRAARIDAAIAAIQRAGPGRATRKLKAEALLYRAVNAPKIDLNVEFCGAELGLEAMHRFESEALQRRLDKRVRIFEDVVAERVPRWSARALFEVTKIYDELDVQVRNKAPKQFRFVHIDDPLRLDVFLPGKELATASVLNGDWTKEILRVYASLLKGQDLDESLRGDLSARIDAAQARNTLFSKSARSPLKRPALGSFRFFEKQFQTLTKDGYQGVESQKAVDTLATLLQGEVDAPGFADGLLAYALGTQSIPNVAVLERALKSENPRTRVAALAAIYASPQLVLRPVLLAHYKGIKTADGVTERPFGSLAGALFGEREWTLKALREIAKVHRNEGLQISYSSALALEERAWILAELADSRSAGRLQELYNAESGRTRAISIYGSYLAAGERMLWMAKANHAGIVRCAAKNVIAEIESKKSVF